MQQVQTPLAPDEPQDGNILLKSQVVAGTPRLAVRGVVQLLENPLIPHGIAQSQRGILCVAIHIQAASTQVMGIVPMVDQIARHWFVEAVEIQNGVTLAVSVPQTQQLALLSSDRLVDDINGEQWRAAKQQVLQARYDLDVKRQDVVS